MMERAISHSEHQAPKDVALFAILSLSRWDNDQLATFGRMSRCSGYDLSMTKKSRTF